MNRKTLIRGLVKVAKILLGMVFNTQEELDAYLKAHPDADKSMHSVKPKAEKTPAAEPEKKPETHKTPEQKPSADTTPSPANPHQKASPSKKSIALVSNIMKANNIEEGSDEVKELAGFKKTLGQRVPSGQEGKWYVRNVQKLQKDFVSNMSASNYATPEAFKSAQGRVKNMTKSDFAKLLAAISSEDEENL